MRMHVFTIAMLDATLMNKLKDELDSKAPTLKEEVNYVHASDDIMVQMSVIKKGISKDFTSWTFADYSYHMQNFIICACFVYASWQSFMVALSF